MNLYLDDGFASQHGGGIAAYTRLLQEALVKQGAVVTPARYPLLERIRPAGLRRIVYTLFLNLVLPWRLRRQGVRVAHFTNYQAPAIRNGLTRYVATIHDLSPVLQPQTNGVLYRRYFGLVVWLTLRRAHVVVTPSESARQALQQRFVVPTGKVLVCPIGLNGTFVTPSSPVAVLEAYSLQPHDYFLFVGRLEKRKNLPTLIRAFGAYKHHSYSRRKLVLVGADGIGAADVHGAIRQSRFRHDIIAPGYVDDGALRSLYAHALAFVLPSHDEGFGIPLLEAMKYNLPLLLSRIPTNREIVGARGHYFDSTNVDELKQLLLSFDERSFEAPDYSNILQTFSAENMAVTHLRAYGHSDGGLNPVRCC